MTPDLDDRARVMARRVPGQTQMGYFKTFPHLPAPECEPSSWTVQKMGLGVNVPQPVFPEA